MKTIRMFETDALICLRLAIKMNETQNDMYFREVDCNLGHGKSFIYKHILAEIYTSIITAKDDVFGRDFD
jgi:hypothetical protein